MERDFNYSQNTNLIAANPTRWMPNYYLPSPTLSIAFDLAGPSRNDRSPHWPSPAQVLILQILGRAQAHEGNAAGGAALVIVVRRIDRDEAGPQRNPFVCANISRDDGEARAADLHLGLRVGLEVEIPAGMLQRRLARRRQQGRSRRGGRAAARCGGGPICGRLLSADRPARRMGSGPAIGRRSSGTPRR